MSIKRDELQKYLNQLLSVENFKDYCPNGLQIEGKTTRTKDIKSLDLSKAYPVDPR
jgi:putative NIF3 family GTP cyclohydrolase 1 type 2